MNKKDLDKFRKLLVDEKDKILKHLEDLEDSSEKDMEIEMTGDTADLASIEINQANIQKIGKREQKLLKKIDQAIARIDDKSYGLCEECGEAIAPGRLMARPVATLCIDCKTDQENLEKRFSDRSTDEDEAGFDEAEEA